MTRSRLNLFLLGLLLVFGFTAGEARAQAVYGSISGSVADAQGAVVPNAKVTITSVDRKTSDTVETNASGVYAKERLLPGRGNSERVGVVHHDRGDEHIAPRTHRDIA